MNHHHQQQQQPNVSAQLINLGVSSRLVYEGSPCDAFPCWNGGTCTEHRRHKKWENNGTMEEEQGKESKQSREYSCRCREPFEGEHCQRRRKDSPPKNGCLLVCPPGMICAIDTEIVGSQRCISVQQAFQSNFQVPSADPRPHPSAGVLFLSSSVPLPSPFLLSSGLFLLILFLLLFCWAGNSSGFLLLMVNNERRKRRRRMEAEGGGKEPLLISGVIDDEEEGGAEEVGGGTTNIEMRETQSWSRLNHQQHHQHAITDQLPRQLITDQQFFSVYIDDPPTTSCSMPPILPVHI